MEASRAWLARLPSPLPVQVQNDWVSAWSAICHIWKKACTECAGKVTWKNLCLFTSLASCSPAPSRFSGLFCSNCEKDEQMSVKTLIYWTTRQRGKKKAKTIKPGHIMLSLQSSDTPPWPLQMQEHFKWSIKVNIGCISGENDDIYWILPLQYINPVWKQSTKWTLRKSHNTLQ